MASKENVSHEGSVHSLVYQFWLKNRQLPKPALVRAASRPLKMDDGRSVKHCVGLWYKHQLVMGRCWSQGAQVAASFGWGAGNSLATSVRSRCSATAHQGKWASTTTWIPYREVTAGREWRVRDGDRSVTDSHWWWPRTTGTSESEQKVRHCRMGQQRRDLRRSASSELPRALLQPVNPRRLCLSTDVTSVSSLLCFRSMPLQ